jgi:hypothetical protein
MNAYELLLEHLRNITGGKDVITPQQLERVVPVSEKQQCVLRKRGDFPIPFTMLGRRVHYSIHDVANHLLDSQKAQNQATASQEPTLKPVATGSRTSSPVKNLSHLFTFSTFFERVTKEANFLNTLQQSLDVHQREERAKELSNKLTTKKEVQSKKKRTI